MNRLAQFRTLLYGFGFIALGLVLASLGPTLPALAQHAHASTGEISRLFIARSIGSTVGALLLGKVYDHRAGHPVLGGSLIFAALLMAAVPLSQPVWLLFMIFLLVGIASASINVGGNILIVAAHGAHVGPYINAIHFAFGLGGFFAPVLAKQFAAFDHSLQWTYLTLAALVALVGFWILTQASPPIHHHTKTAAAAPLNYGLMLLLVFFLFLEVGAEGVVSGWLFTYALKQGASETTAYDVNSAFWATFTLGRLASIPLAMRLRDRSLVLFHLISWTVLTIVLTLLPATTATLYLCALGMGFGMAPIFPTMVALGQRRLQASGKVTGFILFGAALGGMFWPWLVGQLFDRRGPQAFLHCILICLTFGLLTFLIWDARSQRPNINDETALDDEESAVEPI